MEFSPNLRTRVESTVLMPGLNKHMKPHDSFYNEFDTMTIEDA